MALTSWGLARSRRSSSRRPGSAASVATAEAWCRPAPATPTTRSPAPPAPGRPGRGSARTTNRPGSSRPATPAALVRIPVALLVLDLHADGRGLHAPKATHGSARVTVRGCGDDVPARCPCHSRNASTPNRLRRRIAAAIASRVSPERTRRATLFERLTVQRLPWDTVVRLNRYLEVTGKLATAIWVAFIGSVVFGVEWKDIVEDAVNSGRPLENALLFAVGVPTAVFLLTRSMIGFARWRLQRELWRRDVERLSGVGPHDRRGAQLASSRGGSPRSLLCVPLSPRGGARRLRQRRERPGTSPHRADSSHGPTLRRRENRTLCAALPPP